MSYAAESKKIIMNFTRPPSLNDIEEMVADLLGGLPDDLEDYVDGLALQIEDFPDETTEQELELDDPYELLALYRSGKEISPGVESKTAEEDDTLILYRRPILDMWNETGEHLANLLRQVMIEEIARQFDFSDDQIEEMVQNHNSDFI